MSAHSFVGGGATNCAGGSCGVIVGGFTNTLSGAHAFIGGGHNNVICASHHNSQILGSQITTVSANMLHAQRLSLSGIPTANPGVAGVVWNDSGTLKIVT